jgi:hypothetical protein
LIVNSCVIFNTLSFNDCPSCALRKRGLRVTTASPCPCLSAVSARESRLSICRWWLLPLVSSCPKKNTAIPMFSCCWATRVPFGITVQCVVRYSKIRCPAERRTLYHRGQIRPFEKFENGDVLEFQGSNWCRKRKILPNFGRIGKKFGKFLEFF